MSDLNQVNGGPTASGVESANLALTMARSCREKDVRETAYLDALERFFDGFSEKAFQASANRYSAAMAQVAAAYPEDQGVLGSDPNRFNALLGAGRTAEALDERDVAANYYRTLLSGCPAANGPAVSALRHPRELIGGPT